MEIVKHRFFYSGRKDVFRLIPIGDVHLGAKGCDEEEFERTVDLAARDDRTLVVLLGDMVEAILNDDKRWDDRAVADWCYEPAHRANIALAQRDRLIDTLKRIPKERVLGVICGNHEAALRRYHKIDLTLDIARTLDIPYLGEEAFIHLTFCMKDRKGSDHSRSRTFVIFVTHGSGGGRKPGGKANKLVDIASFVEADVTLCGHHHDRFAIRTAVLGLDSKANFIHKERVNVLTGSYLKTYQIGAPSYAARGLYPPTAIGSPVVLINPSERHLEVVT